MRRGNFEIEFVDEEYGEDIPLSLITKIKSKIVDNIEKFVLFKQLMEKHDIFRLEFDSGLEFERPDEETTYLHFRIFYEPAEVDIIALHPEKDKKIATFHIKVTDVETNEVIIS